ncbi:hypothetical protein M408DRAFT_331820 [Serendipita vermifera MAFF 305830]|uniref:Uncharacterized protein n=1 Tax=Serendipita vermifera MAFF 305830 TaxID=933852 RepID=A0A0C3AI16_SERVB|nr:hypothetical protein M408DRAFT_331820 [Serendipita vermifera MAFF 305830]
MSDDCCGECCGACCFGCCAGSCTAITACIQQYCFGKTYGARGAGGPRGCCNCACFSIEDDAQDELAGSHKKKKKQSSEKHRDGTVTEQPKQKADMMSTQPTPDATSATPADPDHKTTAAY